MLNRFSHKFITAPLTTPRQRHQFFSTTVLSAILHPAMLESSFTNPATKSTRRKLSAGSTESLHVLTLVQVFREFGIDLTPEQVSQPQCNAIKPHIEAILKTFSARQQWRYMNQRFVPDNAIEQASEDRAVAEDVDRISKQVIHRKNLPDNFTQTTGFKTRSLA